MTSLEPCAMCAQDQVCNFTTLRTSVAFKIGATEFAAKVPLCRSHISDVATAAGYNPTDKHRGVIMLKIDDVRAADTRVREPSHGELYCRIPECSVVGCTDPTHQDRARRFPAREHPPGHVVTAPFLEQTRSVTLADLPPDLTCYCNRPDGSKCDASFDGSCRAIQH